MMVCVRYVSPPTAEIERLRAERAELLAVLKGMVGGLLAGHKMTKALKIAEAAIAKAEDK